MKGIRNIVFDFGNVLFDLDLPAIPRNFREMLGEEKALRMRQQLDRHRIFELYETGGISSQEFIDALRFASDPPLSEEQVLKAWNSIFIDFPAQRLEMLLTLRQRYQVFLLSNINEMHEKWVANYLESQHGVHDFESRYFDGVYYSHLVRLRKPDPEIYEYLLADAELVPGETVFFDDLEENVAAACALGIRGVVKPREVEILEVVREMFFEFTGAKEVFITGAKE